MVVFIGFPGFYLNKLQQFFSTVPKAVECCGMCTGMKSVLRRDGLGLCAL